MIADVTAGNKATFQKVFYYRRRFPCLRTGYDINAVFPENFYGPGAHASGNDAFYTLVCEPAGEKARLMRGSFESHPRGNFFSLVVHIEHLKRITVPEVQAELFVGYR